LYTSSIKYQEAVNAIEVIQNQKATLPIKNLDKEKISLTTLDFGNYNQLDWTFNKYTLGQIKNISFSDFQYFKVNDENSLNLIAINTEKSDIDSFDFSEIDGSRTILILMGLGVVNKEELSKMKTILFHPHTDAIAQSVCIQALFGGIDLQNIGIEKTRIGYAPPDAVLTNSYYLRSGIRKIMQEGLDSMAFPGGQVLVSKNGKVIYHETFGFHTYDRLNLVNQADLYDYASVTKVTTSLPAIMKFHGEGKFDIDGRLKDYVPEMKKGRKGELLIRDILAHQSRLKPYLVYFQMAKKRNGAYKARTIKSEMSVKYPIKIDDDLFAHKDFTKKFIYKKIRKSSLYKDKKYRYSGLFFLMLPEIVSNISGEKYETFLKKEFYHKLGAWTITFNPNQHFPLDRIVPTEIDTIFRHKLIHGTVHDEASAVMGGLSSNAGLFSSANDLGKLIQMYLNGGKYGGERLIAEESVNEFTRCQFCETGNRRGLGFDKPMIKYRSRSSYISEKASSESFGHSGFTGTFFWADPKDDVILIFFSNRVYPTRENRKLYSLMIRPRVHSVIYDAIDRGTIY
jgi:CubicO group peptidase (beta-lactamase class C family)